MKTFYKELPTLIKSKWLQLHNKSDFYNNLFDAVIDLSDSKQIIDDALTTEDIFIDDDQFSDEDIEDDSKQIIDDILKDINHSEILIAI